MLLRGKYVSFRANEAVMSKWDASGKGKNNRKILELSDLSLFLVTPSLSHRVCTSMKLKTAPYRRFRTLGFRMEIGISAGRR
jgi:hypothetical protein